jgi:hypothetical protein
VKGARWVSLSLNCPWSDSRRATHYYRLFSHMDVSLSHWTLISVLLLSVSSGGMWIMALSPNTFVSLTNFHHCFLLFVCISGHQTTHWQIPVVSEYYHYLPRSVNFITIFYPLGWTIQAEMEGHVAMDGKNCNQDPESFMPASELGYLNWQWRPVLW